MVPIRLPAAFLCWLPVAALALTLVSPAAAQQAASKPLAEELAQRALTQPPAAFEREVRELLERNRQPQALAGALRQTLVKLRGQPPTPAGRWLVDFVIAAPAMVLAPHPERAAVLHDPNGLRAVAEGTRNAWTWRHWRDRVTEAGQSGAWQALDELKKISDAPARQAAIRGAAAGLRELPQTTLQHPELKAQLVADPSLATLTLAVVEQTGDEQLLLSASQGWTLGEQAALSLKLASLLGVPKALGVWRQQLADAGPVEPFARQAVALLARQPGLSADQASEAQRLLEQHP